MAKSTSERVAEWRKKKRGQGGKAITVMLDPEVVDIFEALQKELDLSQAALLSKAILDLRQAVDQAKQPPVDLVSCQAEPVKGGPLEAAVEVHFLAAIKTRLAAGTLTKDLRPELQEAIQAMSREGLSLRAIAKVLNLAGVPTFSGQGDWGKSQVARLLR
jgi:hypothetical protein